VDSRNLDVWQWQWPWGSAGTGTWILLVLFILLPLLIPFSWASSTFPTENGLFLHGEELDMDQDGHVPASGLRRKRMAASEKQRKEFFRRGAPPKKNLHNVRSTSPSR
jgi:hypothetical protein